MFNRQVLRSLIIYTKKMGGKPGAVRPIRKPIHETAISGSLVFTAVLTVAMMDYYVLSEHFEVHGLDLVLLTGVYAATAVMLYDQYHSPMAQPRNIVGGFLIGSVVGVCCRLIGTLLGFYTPLTAALTVMLTVLLMNAAEAVHPPAAGVALLAIIGSVNIRLLGFWYVLTSTGTAVVMLVIAVLGNNFFIDRQYPLYWW